MSASPRLDQRPRVDLVAARAFDGLTNAALTGTQDLVFHFTCVHA